MAEFCFQPIGTIYSCFKEKFGIPRQARLASNADGILKLECNPLFYNAVKDLEQFSHLWIIFVFHQNDAKNWKPSIRPPRLGGSKKVGILSSRSPHRPNPIGISAVQLKKIELNLLDGIELHLGGVDILNGTPVLDIKPYLSYADSIPGANSGWADEPITRNTVVFSYVALEKISQIDANLYPNLKLLISEILELDPRPAFQKRKLPSSSAIANGTSYGFRLLDFDVKWKIESGIFLVTDLVRIF